jgi:hypothetical protein
MKRQTFIVGDEAARARLIVFFETRPLSKPLMVTVEDHRKRRSLSQNGLYWKWVGIVAGETGNDDDVVHDTFKDKFLAPREVEIFGERRLVRTTTKLTTLEMKDYMDKVYAFAVSELGILLPVPEELGRAA